MRRLIGLVGMAALLVTLASVAQACPSCKAALASSDGQEGDWVSGFFWSILFMLSMPFTILAAFGISIYRATRKTRSAVATPAEAGQPAADDAEPELVGSS